MVNASSSWKEDILSLIKLKSLGQFKVSELQEMSTLYSI